jgi:hypothetical protein
MKKNCLTCKYEPDWSAPIGIDYPRQTGFCKWDGVIPLIPAVYVMHREGISKYSDGSGVKTRCDTWEPK